MFLIQHTHGKFVNAEKINWIDVKQSYIKFTLENDERIFETTRDFSENFINNLQALNYNIHNIEKCFKEINNI